MKETKINTNITNDIELSSLIYDIVVQGQEITTKQIAKYPWLENPELAKILKEFKTSIKKEQQNGYSFHVQRVMNRERSKVKLNLPLGIRPQPMYFILFYGTRNCNCNCNCQKDKTKLGGRYTLSLDFDSQKGWIIKI